MPIPLILGLMGAASWVVTMSVAGAFWKSIVEADPSYAAQLYSPPFDQVFYRLGPVNSWVLFRSRAPVAVMGRVRALRVVVVVNMCLAAGFAGSLLCQMAR
ncbi:hypothetical protein [Dyella solisilvae]|nr:hypothetical protein [Dyella solisilvae]